MLARNAITHASRSSKTLTSRPPISTVDAVGLAIADNIVLIVVVDTVVVVNAVVGKAVVVDVVVVVYAGS